MGRGWSYWCRRFYCWVVGCVLGRKGVCWDAETVSYSCWYGTAVVSCRVVGVVVITNAAFLMMQGRALGLYFVC